MFNFKLMLKNKMSEVRQLFQSFQVVGPLSLAIGITWIAFKMFTAGYLKKAYNQLAGKVVVITGASSGLGEALAHEFYKQGCQVVLCARRRQELERVRIDLLHTHNNVTTYPPILIPLDLSEPKELQDHVDKILSITGKIDILINNGGCSYRGLVTSTSLDVDKRIMDINYFGSVAITKACLKSMISRKEGHIVFVSSIQGLIALPERSAYGASKHALQAFSDTLRAEVATHNIFVTTVSPAYIKTKLSLNALTGTGDLYGKTDATTNSGFNPEYVSEAIVRAVVQKKKEIIISPLLPKMAIFIRKFWPVLYFFIMDKRAKKSLKSCN